MISIDFGAKLKKKYFGNCASLFQFLINIYLNYIFFNLGQTRSEILTVSIKALANYTYEIHSLFLFKKSDFVYVLSNILILHRFIGLLTSQQVFFSYLQNSYKINKKQDSPSFEISLRRKSRKSFFYLIVHMVSQHFVLNNDVLKKGYLSKTCI